MADVSTPGSGQPPVFPAARRLLLVALGLTVLVAIVVVASRDHEFRGGGTSPSSSPALIGDYLATFMLIAMPIGVALLILGMVESRRQRALMQRSPRRMSVFMLLGLAAVCLAVVFGAQRFSDRQRGTRLPEPERAGRLNIGRDEQRADRRPSERTPEFRWGTVVVLGSVLLGIAVAVVVTGFRRRQLLASDGTAFRDLSHALDESLDDLHREGDARRAVIAAYARMEKALAVHGLPRHEAEAPLEYLARVLLELHASEPAVRRLTDLFENAKFSPHEIDTGMKQEAIAALAGLRDDLRAIHAPDPPPLARRPGEGPATA